MATKTAGADKPSRIRIRWRQGFRARGVRATTAKAELERIRKKRGAISGEVVAQEAKRRGSPLHPLVYGESDTKALAKYRASLAADLVAAIQIEYTQADGTVIDGPVYYGIRQGGVGGGQSVLYYPREAVGEDERMHGLVLDEALSYLEGFRRRYGHLQELRSINAAIRRYLEGRKKRK